MLQVVVLFAEDFVELEEVLIHLHAALAHLT